MIRSCWWALVACLLAAMSGCALSSLDDGGAIEPGKAYLLVYPHLDFNGRVDDRPFVAELMRVDRDGSQHKEKFTVTSGQATLLVLPPGGYYLRQVTGHLLDFEFPPSRSVFIAKAGQVNYPGDWNVTVWEGALNNDFRNNERSIHYRGHLDAVDGLRQPGGSDVDAAFHAKYPALAQRMPLVYTGGR